jgi:hypothetical protein
MRVLRRDPNPDAVDTVETDADTRPASEADEPTERRAFFRRERDVPASTTTTTRESEVVVEQWSIADAIVAVIGAGFAVVGALVLIRTGVDRSWFRPVEEVADMQHTPLLGALELGGGVLLMLAAASRSRALPAICGLGIAIAGALAAIENDEVVRELAIEKRWAWFLAGVGLLVTIVSLVPPRRRRVERLVES